MQLADNLSCTIHTTARIRLPLISKYSAKSMDDPDGLGPSHVTITCYHRVSPSRVPITCPISRSRVPSPDPMSRSHVPCPRSLDPMSQDPRSLDPLRITRDLGPQPMVTPQILKDYKGMGHFPCNP